MESLKREIELLAPAKNADIGIEAIRHGADAVYIGAPRFGARATAGCSVEEIARLVSFAHRYRAKVYVALNTLLYDNELEEAERMVWQLYEIRVDALIVQDMALLEMNLPPIALHASTQCDNRTKEKVSFLSRCGFSQVVLARELTLEEIREIAASTDISIECFVHGALCVSYSGQCYMSQDYCKRSANRGECAQMCRLPYTLQDANGDVLLEHRHLLSLKDMNASAHLQQMIEAGVSSFKIEGRLKDMEYVKNVTAYYRILLDKIIDAHPNLCRASSGITSFNFQPQINKSFSRGYTSYFLQGRSEAMASMLTPKSLGEYVGKVKKQQDSSFTISTSNEELHNGDGLCLIKPNGTVVGCRLNRVEGNLCYPLQMPKENIVGSEVYRNFDILYNKVLSNASTAERRVALTIDVKEQDNDVIVCLCDENGVTISDTLTSANGEKAKQPERMRDTWTTQFQKLGDTIFFPRKIQVNLLQGLFFPVSMVAAFRRKILEALESYRITTYQTPQRRKVASVNTPPFKTLNYQGNVANQLSKKFYTNCGVKILEPAYECCPVVNAELMRTRYCLKHELGWCQKQHNEKTSFVEPLYIVHGKIRWRLRFDCQRCEMIVCRE